MIEAENKGKPALAAYFCDLAGTIFNFILDNRSIKDVTRTILSIFDDDNQPGEIKFSSIHRSKGLEADRVIYLVPENVPHPMALKSGIGAIIAQEHNLDYVARTRAKKVLIYQELPK